MHTVHMRLRWYGPEHSRSIAHSEAFVHGLALHTAKPSFMDFSSKKEEKKLHGLEKHHGGTKPILLPHTDTSMSAANACLADLLSSTTEKAST